MYTFLFLLDLMFLIESVLQEFTPRRKKLLSQPVELLWSSYEWCIFFGPIAPSRRGLVPRLRRLREEKRGMGIGTRMYHCLVNVNCMFVTRCCMLVFCGVRVASRKLALKLNAQKCYKSLITGFIKSTLKITGYPCNLTGSQQCDLFLAYTVTQYKNNSKTTQ